MSTRRRSRASARRTRTSRMVATTARPSTSPHQSPTGTKAELEAQQVADRQAEEPVAQQVHQHGHPGLTQAAQNAAGHRLGAVEHLEHAGERNERGGDPEHRRLVGCRAAREVSGTVRNSDRGADS